MIAAIYIMTVFVKVDFMRWFALVEPLDGSV